MQPSSQPPAQPPPQQDAARNAPEKPGKPQQQHDPSAWVCVGHSLSMQTRQSMKVHGRHVTLLRLRRRGSAGAAGAGEYRWACIDSVCYHAGGPLAEGTVRGVAGRTCIQCPWHSYLIDVFTGEGLYMDLDRKYRSKGVRQRTHEVEVRADLHVYVRLSAEPADVPSDEYAFGPKFPAAAPGAPAPPLPSFPDW